MRNEQELESAKGCWERSKLFTSYAIQDIGRNKCHFCLAFLSVLVCVWAILVVNTVVQIGPIAFLSLAEKTNG